jgi:hypothetical protein
MLSRNWTTKTPNKWGWWRIAGCISLMLLLIITQPVMAAAEDTASLTVTGQIAVYQYQQPPEIEDINPATIGEGSLVEFNIIASDPDSEVLIYTVGPLPPGSSFNPQTHVFSWTPSYLQSGIYTINFFVSDGYFTTFETAVITVNEVDDPPEIIIEPDQQPFVELGKQVVFKVCAQDPDGNRDEITYSVENLPAGAEFKGPDGNGCYLFKWKPEIEDAGIHEIRFIVNDGYVDTVLPVTITVYIPSQGKQSGAGGYTSYYTAPFSVAPGFFPGEQGMPPDGQLPSSVAEDEIDGKEIITTPIYKQVAKVGTVSCYFRFDRGNCKMLTKIRTEILDIFDQSVEDQIRDTVEEGGLEVREIPFIVTATLEPPCTTGNASLYITVPEQWVLEQGGVEYLRIVHISDTGEAEMLMLEYISGPDKDGNLKLRVDAEHLSVYGMVAVKAKEAAGVTTPAAPSVEPMLVPGGVGFASYVTENPILVAAVAVILIVFAVLEMKFHILRRKEYKHLGAPPEGGPPAWEGLLETDHYKALAGIMDVLNEIDEQLLRLNAMFARPQFGLAPAEAEAIVEKFFYSCQVAEERIKNAAAAEHLTPVQIEKLNTQLSAAVQRMVETSQQSQVLYQLVQAKVGAKT